MARFLPLTIIASHPAIHRKIRLESQGAALPATAGAGTVMRPHTLRQYARQDGFDGVENLSIQNDFFRFYRLKTK